MRGPSSELIHRTLKLLLQLFHRSLGQHDQLVLLLLRQHPHVLRVHLLHQVVISVEEKLLGYLSGQPVIVLLII